MDPSIDACKIFPLVLSMKWVLVLSVSRLLKFILAGRGCKKNLGDRCLHSESLIKLWHGVLLRQIVLFYVANLRNSWLLRAIRALNWTIFHHNLLMPDLIRGFMCDSWLVTRDSSWTGFYLFVLELIRGFKGIALINYCCNCIRSALWFFPRFYKSLVPE